MKEKGITGLIFIVSVLTILLLLVEIAERPENATLAVSIAGLDSCILWLSYQLTFTKRGE